MCVIPAFQNDGLLPPGDYEVNLAELKVSTLVRGSGEPNDQPGWDAHWREKLVGNLSVMVKQLWQVGVYLGLCRRFVCRRQGSPKRH